MAKQVDYWRWWVFDEVSGKERRTRFHMDAETAQERYPGCRPAPETREVRTIYEPGEAPLNTLPPRTPT